MRYEASLSAFDMLDQVHVFVTLRATPESVGAHQETVLVRSTTVPGTGEGDPVEWVRDALLAILETL